MGSQAQKHFEFIPFTLITDSQWQTYENGAVIAYASSMSEAQVREMFGDILHPIHWMEDVTYSNR